MNFLYSSDAKVSITLEVNWELSFLNCHIIGPPKFLILIGIVYSPEKICENYV